MIISSSILFSVFLGGAAWIDHYGNERDLYLIVIQGKNYLLLYDGLLHEAPDDETVQLLKPLQSSNASQALSSMGSPLQSLKPKVHTPDEIIRMMVFKSQYASPPLTWLSFTHLGPFLNPSIAIWKNQTIICYKMHIDADIEVKSLEDPTLRSAVVFGNGQNCFTNSKLASWHFQGEDARMISMPDGKLQFFYTSHNEWLFRMFTTSAHLNESSRVVSFDKANWFTVLEHGYPGAWGRYQKNWVPFVHEGKILLIQSINPLHVMELVEKGDPARGEPGCGVPSNVTSAERNESKAFSRTFSLVDAVQIQWDYGQLRGGTPGVLLPDGKHYLSIFHSRCKLPGNVLETYFMGALTWFMCGSVFQIYSVSRAPIVNVSLYDGAWAPNRSGRSRFDYVVFPVGLLLSDDNQSVSISFGHQDVNGMLATISLKSLLGSMMRV